MDGISSRSIERRSSFIVIYNINDFLTSITLFHVIPVKWLGISIFCNFFTMFIFSVYR